MRLATAITSLALVTPWLGPTAARAGGYERHSLSLDTTGLTFGGGVEGFTDAALRDRTDPGAGWGVRAQLSTRSILSLELAYVGAAQGIQGIGLEPNATLLSNGFEADLRLNVVPLAFYQPYVFAGFGWRRYDVINTDTAFADVADHDNAYELPLGIGLGVHFNQMSFDARAQYRRAVGNNDLVPATGDDHIALHRWSVTGNIGFEF